MFNLHLKSFSVVLISTYLSSIICEDDIGEFHTMVGEWLEYTFICQKQLDDSGSTINYNSCITLWKGDPGLDTSLGEYTPCKCLSACISKKIGTLKADGSGWNFTRVNEVITLMGKEEQYKPFVEELNTKIRPICDKSVGENCELAFNTIKCIFDQSESARNFRDMFTGMLKSSLESSTPASS